MITKITSVINRKNFSIQGDLGEKKKIQELILEQKVRRKVHINKGLRKVGFLSGHHFVFIKKNVYLKKKVRYLKKFYMYVYSRVLNK